MSETIPTSDPVVDEIRAVRHEISERLGHDPVRLVEYYMKLQEQYADRFISFPQHPRARGKSAA
jgi:hypothetical protein